MNSATNVGMPPVPQYGNYQRLARQPSSDMGRQLSDTSSYAIAQKSLEEELIRIEDRKKTGGLLERMSSDRAVDNGSKAQQVFSRSSSPTSAPAQTSVSRAESTYSDPEQLFLSEEEEGHLVQDLKMSQMRVRSLENRIGSLEKKIAIWEKL